MFASAPGHAELWLRHMATERHIVFFINLLSTMRASPSARGTVAPSIVCALNQLISKSNQWGDEEERYTCHVIIDALHEEPLQNSKVLVQDIARSLTPENKRHHLRSTLMYGLQLMPSSWLPDLSLQGEVQGEMLNGGQAALERLQLSINSTTWQTLIELLHLCPHQSMFSYPPIVSLCYQSRYAITYPSFTTLPNLVPCF